MSVAAPARAARAMRRAAVLAGVAAGLFIAGARRERARARRLVDALERAAGARGFDALDRGAGAQGAGRASLAALGELPAPVRRYLRTALVEGQPVITSAHLRQAGRLRTGPRSGRWLAFTARQHVVPAAPGFVSEVRVELPLGAHLRVLDSYVEGSGAGRVSLLSAIALASAAGAPELASGALHRYLAEAVWYPSALLPAAGVRWTAIDDHAALATLSDRGSTVSLEFRFDAASADVVAIYSPGRWGRFDGAYRQLAWEGHFRDHRTLDNGMRVPGYGEVGWYNAGVWEPVWQGRLLDATYQPAPEAKETV